MDLDLAGKTAVVTGASKGIGLAVTTALVAEGAQVIAGSRSSSSELDALGDAVRFVAVDLSTPTGPDALIAEAADGLDILGHPLQHGQPRAGRERQRETSPSGQRNSCSPSGWPSPRLPPLDPPARAGSGSVWPDCRNRS